ncbi:hypothetical protein AAGG52_00835 [Bacillus licheniformis]
MLVGHCIYFSLLSFEVGNTPLRLCCRLQIVNFKYFWFFRIPRHLGKQVFLISSISAIV